MATQLLEREKPLAGARGPGGAGGIVSLNGHGPGPFRSAPAPRPAAAVALGAVLAAVTMLFLGFVTAYLAHRQQPGWPAIRLPWVLWPNTAVLVASSLALEWGRAGLRRADAVRLRNGVAAAVGLGGLFLAGQLVAWTDLARQGLVLASNPRSAFIYLLTGAHGLHLLGGLAALGVVLVGARRGRYTPAEHDGVDRAALFWHFLDGLWAVLLALLAWGG